MDVIEALRAESITFTHSSAALNLNYYFNAESITQTGSEAELYTLVPFTADSVTYADSSGIVDILVRLNAESVTTTQSSAFFRIRTYKSEPKKYRKSEPIFIYDRDEKFQMILSDDTLPYREGWFPEQLNGEVTLEFEVIANHPDVAKIMEDGRAVVRNVDGEYAEFIIRIIDDTDGDGTFKKIEAEGGEYELIDHIVTQYKASNVNLRTALGAVIQGSRWQVGQVDDLGTQSVDLQRITCKAAVYELLNLYGAEVRYRVEIEGNRIVRRYIDAFKQRGTNPGKRFEAGKDIVSTNRSIDTSGIKTRLYGYGKSGENDGPRLTFADVEWEKENGDPVDKPRGQTWVGDPDALNKWGYDQGTLHRTGIYDGQEEDPAELLLNTWNHLQTVNDAIETYDFDVLTLEELTGYSHEKVRLGDIIYAVNRNIYPHVEVEASIIEYRHNLNDRSQSKVTLGSFRNVYDISNRFERVEQTVNDRQGNWNEKPNTEDVENIAENEAQKAIDEAQERIDEATQELKEAMERIAQGKIDLEEAEQLIQDTIDNPQNYKGDFVGDLIADSLIVRGPIVSQSATITGRLLASGAVFVQADIEKGNIIDANIQNARITGQLDSVNGTFIGDLVGGRILSNTSINVNTDLYVGNNIYLGSMLTSSQKRIYFNNNANLTAIESNIAVNADALRLSNSTVEVSLSNVVRSSIPGLEFYYTTNNKSAIFHDHTNRHRLKLEAGPNGQASFWMDPQNGNWYLLNEGTVKHTFYSGGSKDGGSIEIDNNRYGMSPIDSPQTLIYDLLTDILVDGEVTIYLDSLYAKAVSKYSVFPSNQNIEVVSKTDDCFIVYGNGLTDFQIIGTRVGFEGTYFTDLTKMSQDLAVVDDE